MSHIFISYSRRDLDFAQKIVTALADNKLDTWIDWKSIPKGEDWEQEIYRGIEEADAFLFLISPDSVASEMCNKEIAHAAKNGKRVLPVFIANVEDRGIYSITEKFPHEEQKKEISRRNFIKCRDGRDDFNQTIEEIRTAIHMDYEWLKYHTKLQVKALDWERTKDNSRLLRGKELREAEEQLAGAGSLKDPQPTELHRNYVLASQRNEVRQRRQITIGLGFGLAIVAMLAVFAWNQRNSALNSEATAIAEANAKATALVNEENARATAQAEKERAEEQARVARANELATYAFNEDSLDLSLLLGIEAIKSSPTYQARNLMMTRISELPYLFKFLFGNPDSVQREFLSGRYMGTSEFSHTSSVAFSPDGKTIAIGGCHTFETMRDPLPKDYCTEGEITLWDINSYKKIGTLVGHKGLVTNLVFSQSGELLISSGAESLYGDTVILWDVSKQKIINQISYFSFGKTYSLAISSDGRWLAITPPLMGSYFTLWDFSTNETIDQGIPDFAINTLTFSPDGKTLALGGCGKFDETYTDTCVQGEIILWDVATQKQIGEPLRGHSSVVSSLTFNPFGNLVSGSCITRASTDYQNQGCVNGEILLWEIGFLISPPDIQSQNGDILLLVPLEQQTDSGVQFQPIEIMEHTSYVKYLLYTPGGDLISVSKDKIIFSVVHNFKENVLFPIGYGNAITGVTLSPDGTILALGYEDGTAALWNLENPFPVLYKSTFGENSCKRSLAMQPGDTNTLATIEEDGTISFWDYSSGKYINTIASDDPVSTIAFSPNGKKLATGSLDGKIAIWNSKTFRLETPYLPAHSSWVNNLDFDPDGKYLVSSGMGDNTIKFWNVDPFLLDGEPAHQDGDWVGDVAFSHDSKMLITIGSQNDPVSFFDVMSRTLRESRFICPEGAMASTLAVSPNGKLLAIGCGDASILVLDISSMQPVGKPLFLHSQIITKLIFSPDNQVLISASQDGSVIFWDMNNLKPIGNPLKHRLSDSPYWASNISINTTGNIFAAIPLPCGPITLWSLDPIVWANQACEVVGRNFTQAEWQQYFPGEEYSLTCPQWPAGE